MLSCDVGKTAGDIRPTGERDTLDFRADRRQSGTDIVATIEKGGEPGPGNCLASRGDKRPEPARTHIAAGIRRAGEHDRPTRSHRGRQRGNRLNERVDKDNRIAQLCRQCSPPK